MRIPYLHWLSWRLDCLDILYTTWNTFSYTGFQLYYFFSFTFHCMQVIDRLLYPWLRHTQRLGVALAIVASLLAICLILWKLRLKSVQGADYKNIQEGIRAHYHPNLQRVLCKSKTFLQVVIKDEKHFMPLRECSVSFEVMFCLIVFNTFFTVSAMTSVRENKVRRKRQKS